MKQGRFIFLSLFSKIFINLIFFYRILVSFLSDFIFFISELDEETFVEEPNI